MHETENNETIADNKRKRWQNNISLGILIELNKEITEICEQIVNWAITLGTSLLACTQISRLYPNMNMLFRMVAKNKVSVKKMGKLIKNSS